MALDELRRLEAGAKDTTRTMLQQYEAHKEFDASVRNAAPALLEIAEWASEFSRAYKDGEEDDMTNAMCALFAAVERMEEK